MILFREILKEDAQKLLMWRLQPRVAEWMLTQVDNDLPKQQAWIERTRTSDDTYHWIVQIKGTDAAYAKIEKFDPIQATTEMGFYIGEERYTAMTVGILHAYYAALFKHFALKAILGSILEGNSALRIHKYSGYEPDSERPSILVDGNPPRRLLPYILRREVFLQKHPCRNVPDLPVVFWKAHSLHSCVGTSAEYS